VTNNQRAVNDASAHLAEGVRASAEATVAAQRLDEVGARVPGDMAGGMDNQGGVVQETAGKVADITKAVQYHLMRMEGEGKQAMYGLARGMASAAGEVQGAAVQIGDVSQMVRQRMAGMEAAGQEAMAGLARGVTSRSQQIIDVFQRLAEAAINAARARFQISSPSRVMETIGEQVGEGMVVGVASKVGDVVDATTSVMEAGRDAAEDMAVNAISAHEAEIAAIEMKMSYMREELDLRRAIAEEARANRSSETPGIGTTVSTNMQQSNQDRRDQPPPPPPPAGGSRKKEPDRIIIQFEGASAPKNMTPEQVAAIVNRTMKNHDRAGR
jgi:hypothetical protein